MLQCESELLAWFLLTQFLFITSFCCLILLLLNGKNIKYVNTFLFTAYFIWKTYTCFKYTVKQDLTKCIYITPYKTSKTFLLLSENHIFVNIILSILKFHTMQSYMTICVLLPTSRNIFLNFIAMSLFFIHVSIIHFYSLRNSIQLSELGFL